MPNVFSKPAMCFSVPDDIWYYILDILRGGQEWDPLDLDANDDIPLARGYMFNDAIRKSATDFKNLAAASPFFANHLFRLKHRFPHALLRPRDMSDMFFKKTTKARLAKLSIVKRLCFSHPSFDVGAALALVDACKRAPRLTLIDAELHLKHGSVPVTRYVLQRAITTVLHDQQSVTAIDWRVDSVPVLGILREIAYSRMKSISLCVNAKDERYMSLSDKTALPSVVWDKLARLHISIPTPMTTLRYKRVFVFESLTGDSFPCLREVSFKSLVWDKELVDFLARCPVLETLAIASSYFPGPGVVRFPRMDNVETLVVSPKVLLLIVHTHLPRLRTLVILNFTLLFSWDETMRKTKVSYLSHVLSSITSDVFTTNFKEVIIDKTCSDSLASQPWNEDALENKDLRRTVSALKERGVLVKDERKRLMRVPFELKFM